MPKITLLIPFVVHRAKSVDVWKVCLQFLLMLPALIIPRFLVASCLDLPSVKYGRYKCALSLRIVVGIGFTTLSYLR